MRPRSASHRADSSDGIQRDGYGERRQLSNTIGDPAEKAGSKQLSEVRGGDQRADISLQNVPERREDRHDSRDGVGIVGVESVTKK